MVRNYRVQPCCRDCKFVFNCYDYLDKYYCTLNAPERPLCGSVWLKEEFLYNNKIRERRTNEEAVLLESQWIEWAKRREVDPCGTCDCWEPKLTK